MMNKKIKHYDSEHAHKLNKRLILIGFIFVAIFSILKFGSALMTITGIKPSKEEYILVSEPDLFYGIVTPEPEKTFKDIYGIEEDDAKNIAILVMAEAEGEPEYGKRLVIDTVLNRVDHKAFPDTVNDVIFQKHQYSPTENGRFERCFVKDDIWELVLSELTERTNYDAIFFRTLHYSEYGVPMEQVGHHFFSSYD